MDKHTSKLEALLDIRKPIEPAAEHEVDLLRDILQGQAGTTDQRAALIRIISQNKPAKLVLTTRLMAYLGTNQNTLRSSYT